MAQQDNLASVLRYSFVRTLDGKDDRISRFVVTPDSSDGDAKSYGGAMSPADFVKFGFSTDSDGTLVVYRPDVDVLADDAFAAEYCFHLDSSGTHRREAGVAFATADRRPGRVDIAGTLWLDTVARAVLSVEFRYVGLPDRTAPFRPGGVISFHQMTSGAMLVDWWQVRHPEAALDTLAAFPAWDVHTRSWLYATESGTELAHVAWPDGRSWQAPLGTLRVHAVTGAGQPAAGVLLVLPGTPFHGTTDIGGNLTIPDLLPGPYTIESRDTRAAALGIAFSAPVKFVAARDSTTHVAMTLTTVDEYVIRHCIDAHQWTLRDSVFLLGRVQSLSGEPIGHAKVTVAVKDKIGKWKSLNSDFTTAADGLFESCDPDLQLGTDVRIRVHRPDVEDVVTTAMLGAKLTVVVGAGARVAATLITTGGAGGLRGYDRSEAARSRIVYSEQRARGRRVAKFRGRH